MKDARQLANDISWMELDTATRVIEADRAEVRKECAEKAIAWRHKKYSCTVPGVDEELCAAIVGKEGE